jgi:hypothetical protein
MARSDIDSPLPGAAESEAAVDLYWLPLGRRAFRSLQRTRIRGHGSACSAASALRAVPSALEGCIAQARFAIEITPVRAAAAEQ